MTDRTAIGESLSEYYARRSDERKARWLANDYIGCSLGDVTTNPTRFSRRIAISKTVYADRAKRIRRTNA